MNAKTTSRQLRYGLTGLLLCLFASLTLNAATTPKGHPSRHLFITGILQNQWEGQAEDDLLIELYDQYHCVARTFSREGMFTMDLFEDVHPNQKLMLVVRAQISSREKSPFRGRYKLTVHQLDPDKAQNILMPVELHEIHKGRIYRLFYPYRGTGRRGCKTLYINNI